MKSKYWIFTFVFLLSFSLVPFGVFARDAEPFTLEAPENLTVELKKDQNNWSYFAMTVDVQEAVREITQNLGDDFQH